MTPDAQRRVEEYRAFLAAKAQLAPASGLEVDPDEVHPALMPHQRDAVLWAVRGGPRALTGTEGIPRTLWEAC